MFDTKDILGFLFLLGGLAMASNMSLVTKGPKPLTNNAEKNSSFLVSEIQKLDESVESSMLMKDFAQLPPQNYEPVKISHSPVLTRPRRAQKLVLNGN